MLRCFLFRNHSQRLYKQPFCLRYNSNISITKPKPSRIKPYSQTKYLLNFDQDRVLQERMACVHAYIQSKEYLNAQLLIHKIYRFTHNNEKKPSQIEPFNALIQSFLGLDQSTSFEPDLEKALSIYEYITTIGFSPDINTFAIFAFHLEKVNNVSKMMELLKDMKKMNLSYRLFFNHPYFYSNPDSVKLKSFLFDCGIEMDSEPLNGSLNSNHQEIDVNGKGNEENKENEYGCLTSISSILSTPSPSVRLLSKTMEILKIRNSTIDKHKLQQLLEKESQRLALLEYDDKTDKLPGNLRQFNMTDKKLILEWLDKMIRPIQEEIKMLETHETKQENINQDALILGKESKGSKKPKLGVKNISFGCKQSLAALLKRLKPQQLALITISCFLAIPSPNEMKSGSLGQITFANLVSNIGRSIQNEISADFLTKKGREFSIQHQENLYHLKCTGKLRNAIIRKEAIGLARKEYDRNLPWNPLWNEDQLIQAGSLLAGLLIQYATIKVKDPKKSKSEYVEAFIHTYKRFGVKEIGVVNHHSELLKNILSLDTPMFSKYLPMIVPPAPWINWRKGGYLTPYCRSDMVRADKCRQTADYLDESDKNDYLDTIFYALDCLGSTAWTINSKMLDIIKICWNSKDSWPSIPSGNPIPKLPDLTPEQKLDIKTVKSYKYKLFDHQNKEKNRYSQRCDTNYKVIIAEAFRDQVIYFPHSLDFRGRAYPIPTYLNHIGSDLCRGLLLFDIEKPLGRRGLQWLKIHIANLYGVDKISFSDREKFIEEHLDDIYDSADHPLDGKMWWKEADSPWQCLASCIELAAALRCPDPTLYLSKLPVHQDGTCNGLQHYAAIGGDVAGAKLVNLTPGDRPADVYTGVANSVAESIKKDAEKGYKLAKMLDGFISRKLVKQTVMTNTYGVTRIGAKAQVLGRLNDITDLNMSGSEKSKAASYISNKIFETLEQSFQGARDIQFWLVAVAKIISHSIDIKYLSPLQIQEGDWVIANGFFNLNDIHPDDIVDDIYHEDVTEFDEMNQGNVFSDEMDVNETHIDTETEEMFLDDESELIKKVSKPKKSKKPKKPKGETKENESSNNESTEPNEPIETKEEKEDREANEKKESKEKEKKEKKRKESKLKDTSIVWTTPLGLPVVQPYWNHAIKRIKTIMQAVQITDRHAKCPIDSKKQTQAFPPNFIHSLDASHMMLSAIECYNQESPITFASVHDSYWTHPTDIDKMSIILRDSFIDLHSEDLMKRLHDELKNRYQNRRFLKKLVMNKKEYSRFLKSKGKKISVKKKDQERFNVEVWIPFDIPCVPLKGDFDIKCVRDSPYFFH